MKTKEIGITALQQNGAIVIVKETTCYVFLINGQRINLKCHSPEDANEVKNVILYYPNNKENAAYEFKFEIEYSISNEWNS